MHEKSLAIVICSISDTLEPKKKLIPSEALKKPGEMCVMCRWLGVQRPKELKERVILC